MIREAEFADAPAISDLVAQLGFSSPRDLVEERIRSFADRGEPVLVAGSGAPLGCITWHVTPVLHRPRPVGRITMLVVSEEKRGTGLGRALVAEVEDRLVRLGCGLMEVTSNYKLADAHLFYERLGFERTSHRFGRPLAG